MAERQDGSSRRRQTYSVLQRTLELMQRLADSADEMGWSDQADRVRQQVERIQGRLSVAPELLLAALPPRSAAFEVAEAERPAPGERAESLPIVPGGLEALTPRQRDVALLIASGALNAEIAQQLVLSPGSVANYVAAIFSRLGLSNRAQIATWVAEHRDTGNLPPLIGLLEALQDAPRDDLRVLLSAAAQHIMRHFGADKVDVFVLDEHSQQLVARGVSDTLMGCRERELGLDRLPVRHGGRAAWVHATGQPFLHGHADVDSGELMLVARDLGVRSTMAVPLSIPGASSGVLMVNSARPDAFSAEQLRQLSFVARWLELIAARPKRDART